MKRLWGLLALLALALGSPANASSSLWDDGFPPPAYTGDASTTVSFVSDVATLCHIKVPDGYTLEACGWAGGQIIVPNPCSSEYRHEVFARLVCHELGHFHGWPKDHPR